jgi:hypothetical protein
MTRSRSVGANHPASSAQANPKQYTRTASSSAPTSTARYPHHIGKIADRGEQLGTQPVRAGGVEQPGRLAQLTQGGLPGQPATTVGIASRLDHPRGGADLLDIGRADAGGDRGRLAAAV